MVATPRGAYDCLLHGSHRVAMSSRPLPNSNPVGDQGAKAPTVSVMRETQTPTLTECKPAPKCPKCGAEILLARSHHADRYYPIAVIKLQSNGPDSEVRWLWNQDVYIDKKVSWLSRLFFGFPSLSCPNCGRKLSQRGRKIDFSVYLVLELPPANFYEGSPAVVDQTTELGAHTTTLEDEPNCDITHDLLTGLPNRALLLERLEQALNVAQQEKTRLAILVMELDRFREVNDTPGHHNGDRLFKQVAARLQAAVPRTATVAYLGGDEFAVMVTKIDSTGEATEVARAVGQALQTPFELEGSKLAGRASIGIAVFPEHGADTKRLLQCADMALYMAKHRKSGYAVYDPMPYEPSPHRFYAVYEPTPYKPSPHRVTLTAELRHAIETDELVLYYQPTVNIKTRQVTAAEALVRWQHPQHALLYPDEFLPLAERTGLIKPLTLWVLTHALQQRGAWKKMGLDIGVAVNMSASGLHDRELPDLIAGLLATHGVVPDRLILEIAETSIMIDQERESQILTRLADMGVRLAIDHFGAGYSSLADLCNLPVSEIKIGKSLVMDMNEDPKHAMIVSSTIDLAHNLGLEVVGEGAFNKGTFEQLEKLDCDAVQGEYISWPLSAEEFSGWTQGSPWRPRRGC